MTGLTAAGAELVERLLAGDERALARAISAVENEEPGFEGLLHALHGRVGRARRIGITGPPGSGKSTLAAGLARLYRRRGLAVAIVAVDPTSPFTGGALLGDRVRMTELSTEEGIFIRSMASRGSAGGLATATREVVDLMDAFGFDRILVETLGVGQAELDIAGSADTTALVLVPESGDGIQAMKAGLMEVADLFVVNKSDRPGAPALEREILVTMAIRQGRFLRGVPAHDRHHRPVAPRGMAAGGGPGAGAPSGGETGEAAGVGPGKATTSGAEAEAWSPPVVRTVASTGEGLPRLLEELDRHYAYLERSGELERRRRRGLVDRARAVLFRRLERAAGKVWEANRERWEESLAAGSVSPYEVAETLFREVAAPDPG